MLSDTLNAGLTGYEIGPKVRELRLKKKLGLVQLGGHTGLSPGLLSKIERGQLFPTLPTLLRIAMVFGVSLEHFFAASRARPTGAVVRKADRLRLPNRAGEKSPAYFFESLDYPAKDRKMEAYYAEFEAQSKPTDPHRHPGAEIIYVMSGELVVNLAGDDTTLSEGDSMYFDCGYEHSYRRVGRASCSVIVVVTPQGT